MYDVTGWVVISGVSGMIFQLDSTLEAWIHFIT